MPFPLAHPVAVWPLRRWCPKHLSFGALIAGSLIPDLGYLFDGSRVAAWTHTFWSGGIGFCLPAGMAVFWLACGIQRLALPRLPARWTASTQQLLAPCTFAAAAASVLLGAWTHISLDSLTHLDGWVVQHVPLLQERLSWLDSRHGRVCDLLYYIFTVSGIACLGVCIHRLRANRHSSTPEPVLSK